MNQNYKLLYFTKYSLENVSWKEDFFERERFIAQSLSTVGISGQSFLTVDINDQSIVTSKYHWFID